MEFKLCVFSSHNLAEVVEQQVEGILHELSLLRWQVSTCSPPGDKHLLILPKGKGQHSSPVKNSTAMPPLLTAHSSIPQQ